MIVRILSEGQYRLGGAHLDELNALDNQIVSAVGQDNESEFRRLLTKMVTLVKQNGAPLEMSELLTSDVMLPSEDISLEEARQLFVGEGVIPG